MRKSVYQFKLKRFLNLCLLVFAMLLPSQMFGQDVTSNLYLHYTFDNVDGTLVPDATGNNLTGMLAGGAVADAGYFGSAVVCTEKADHVILPNDMFQTFATDFSFTAWVKVNALGNWSRIFDFGQNDVSNISYLATNQGGGMPKFTIYRSSGNDGYLDVVSNTSFPVGAWVHVAVTVQGGVTGKMYFNGTEVGTGTYNKNQSTIETISFADLGTTETITNYIGKSHWDDAALNGKIDDVRIYTRALSATDIAALASEEPQSELFTQWKNLELTNISALTDDITLPTTLGANGVVVSWKASSSFISSTGDVTRHPLYDMPVDLTATVSQPGVTTETLEKVFTATVLGEANLEPGLIAQWDFSGASISTEGSVIKVKDVSGSNFEGTVKNTARIRTIGESTLYNVLDLGNSDGYFDLGTAIGEAVYSLRDFSVGGYYRMDLDYADWQAWGNNLFSFSNSEMVIDEPKGTMYICLGNTNYGISPGAWNSGGENGVNPSNHPARDTWHHVLYVQEGNVGTIYVDGVLVKSGSVGWKPYNTLIKEGMTGTQFNWIGRPPYKPSGDVYLRKTLVYDFQLYNLALTADDVVNMDYESTLGNLNTAYLENPDKLLTELITEAENLTIPNMNAITGSLVLPKVGVLDPTISIGWKSSLPHLIDSEGNLNQPDYVARELTLTAILVKNGQATSKTFNVTLLPKPSNAFTSDLLLKHDFETVAGSNVTDAAQQHFVGTVVNDAYVSTIGTSETGVYGVLALGSTNGYFDLGTEVGKLIAGLKDFTIGAFFRIDPAYGELGLNGNFLWNFSNSDDIVSNGAGYYIGSLKNLASTITPTNWGAEQTVTLATPALQGNFHHFAYKQSGTTGTIYIDGLNMGSGEVTQLLSPTLVKGESVGTLFNWIGRSCYVNDKYLRNTLVTDFRMYRRALTDDEVMSTEMDVTNKLIKLEAAYAAKQPTSVDPANGSRVRIISGKGQIRIDGLIGTEKVSVSDLMGRQHSVKTASVIELPAGIYILNVDGKLSKVIVK